MILGREGKGTVIATGPSKLNNIKVGDRVVYIGSLVYTEYTVTLSVKAHVVPSELRAGIAATVLIQGLTTLTLICKVYTVQKGNWVLVYTVAGRVGLWLC
jgi:NADPH2:quinone reductase